MEATALEIEDKIDELLFVLDGDIEHIQQSLLRLNELRSLVIKRDDAALCKLLESIQAESNSYKSHELKRQSLRKELATSLGCNFERVTLSGLEAILPEGKKAQINERKVELKSLTEQLKEEHLSTAMLLSDCARFNSLLLKSVFDLGKTGMIYYNSNGAAKRQIDRAFVNLEF